MEATKNKPRCASQCMEHVFQLVNHNGNNKHNVRVTFCPKFRRDPYPPEKTIPQFNLDNRYYTQAFVLGTERKALTNNHHQDLMNFQTMTKDACQKNNQIVIIQKIQFFPKPNEKNSYCSVCKEHFQNYYEHIREQSHRTKIDAAIYNTQIKRLCDFYKDLWPNSHTKADQIVRDLMKQSEMIKKGTKDENDEQESQQEGSQNDELEEEQDQENQGEEGEEQEEDQQEQYVQESEQVRGRKKKGLYEEHKTETYQNEKKKRNPVAQHRQNYTQKIVKQAREHSEQLAQKFKIGQTFFDIKPADFVVFLKKNKQGKYRMVRDLDPMLKNGEFAEDDEDVNQDSYPRDDERKNQRLPPKSSRDDKTKEYYKIRKPQPEVQDDENEKDSSDFSLQEGKNGYSSKNHNNNNADRIRTRKQQKQDKKQLVNAQKEYQTHPQKQTPKQPQINNSRAYPPYQMTPQMYQQINAQRMQAHMNKSMGQNPQAKMPMMQGHMDPQMPQIPKMPMQGMQYPPMYFQPGQQPKGPANGQVRMSHPYARFYQPNMNMMGPYMPMGGVPVPKPDQKKQKGPQQPFPQPQQMYYPQAWGNYMMPQQMMRHDGTDQRGQMVPPMNYQMMQNPNKPPQPGMQPQGQKMNMYMPYQMDPRYVNPYGYPQHVPPSPQQYLQKKTEPNKQTK